VMRIEVFANTTW